MNKRFPIGLKFYKKRFPKAKELTEYTILNIYTTKNENDNIVKIEYLVSHDFLGQRVTDLFVDTTIAKCLSNDELAKYN